MWGMKLKDVIFLKNIQLPVLLQWVRETEAEGPSLSSKGPIYQAQPHRRPSR